MATPRKTTPVKATSMADGKRGKAPGRTPPSRRRSAPARQKGGDSASPGPPRVVGDPSFSSVEFRLGPGESVLGGESRMIFRSGDVVTTAKTQGIGKAIARGLAGAGFAINEFKGAGQGGGVVAFAGIAPGGVVEASVSKDSPMVLSRQTFVCCDPHVEVGAKFNFRGIFEVGQEEGFLLPRAAVPPDADSPYGRIWLSAFGHIQKHDLQDGQSLWVDNGCFVACEVLDPSKPPYTIDTAVKGLMQSLLSGEGFAMRFEGPATVWTQNRNLNDFAYNIGRLIDPPTSLDAVEAGSDIVSGIGSLFTGGSAANPPARTPSAKAKPRPTKPRQAKPSNKANKAKARE